MMAPFTPGYYIELPQDLIGWLGLLFLLVLEIWIVWQGHEKQPRWNRMRWLLFGGLLVSVLICTSFLGVPIKAGRLLPVFERPEAPRLPYLMFFSALPWMIAGGILGPLPGALVGLASGILRALLDTHSIFTPALITGTAITFSLLVRQRYRTLFFSLLRNPLISALALIPIYAALLLAGSWLSTAGPIVTRLDFALARLGVDLLAGTGEIVTAGIVAELLARSGFTWWGRRDVLRPAPPETSLRSRFLYNVTPLVGLLIIILVATDWFVAQKSAKTLLDKQMVTVSQVAADGIPFFLESGQNLILKFSADSELTAPAPELTAPILQAHLESIPFFRQLVLLDNKEELVASYPKTEMVLLKPSEEERLGFSLALKGVQVQTYTVLPVGEDQTAQVAFLAPVFNAAGDVERILWGRADLSANPFSQPVIKTLESIKELGGKGFILDETGKILYSTAGYSRGQTLFEDVFSEPVSYENTAPDGTRQYVRYHPAQGRPWVIVLTIPSREIQQRAFNVALPLLVVMLGVVLTAYVVISANLRLVTGSLGTLTSAAGKIAQGQLDNPLPVSPSEDEVGQLRRSFEQMRISLRSRLEELNQLLLVSQGVASSLEAEEAMQPILTAALRTKACLSRIVLEEEPGWQDLNLIPVHFGVGPDNERYSYLDQEILVLTRQHGTLALNNLSRGRGLNIPTKTPHPEALLAVALRHENRFYGTLWVAYNEPHLFNEEETRFIQTLAGQAALAAANARLYETAEAGRRRLEAVLAATPDPVLVIDPQQRVLLANPAVLQLPDLLRTPASGLLVREIIAQPELLDFLKAPVDLQASREINFANGRTYFITISSIFVEQQTLGKVCILRDITHYKELGDLQSEFIELVSHDLRSPLTLMRGYATMLQMVGDLNDTQKGYVNRIVNNVESMTVLVDKLLDLGKIEAGVALSLDTVRADELAERVIVILQAQAAQKSITLKTDIVGRELLAVQGDSALLQQALYNLVENAVKYTPVGGKVTVSVAALPSAVLWSVRDTGPGIAPLDQPRLFEKFYRSGTRDNYPQRGTGLGLAIVKTITERHHGRVWLESQLGRGSTFFLQIPLRQPDKPEKA